MSLWKSIKQEFAPVFTPAGNAIAGIQPQDWASPNQPIRPIAPPGIGIRTWDFRPALNMDFTPRGDLPVSFPMLRQISNSWDVCRLLIETCKDQIVNRPWTIRVKAQPGETKRQRLEREAKNSNIAKVTKLLEYPDGVHPFPVWLRMWLDQLLVFDAPCIYPVRNMLGDVMALRVVSGATITPLVDEQGFTPAPPSPAYQQIILGLPTANLLAPGQQQGKPKAREFTADEFVYSPRNPRCDSRWGFGPVEQIIATLAIASRRQEFLKAYYTEGNVPEGLLYAPEGWNADQIKSFQTWLDNLLAGNLAKKRRLIMAPNNGKSSKGVDWAKSEALTDGTDEYLVKVVAFAFSITPQGLIKQMNRASAKQAGDTSNEEGVEPRLKHVEQTINYIISRVLGLDDVEFQYAEKREVDPLKQAQTDEIYLKNGAYTINEIREARGDDPRPEAEADMLGVITLQGFMPIEQGAAVERSQAMQPPKPEPEAGPPTKKVDKSAPLRLTPALTSANQPHRDEVAQRVGRFPESAR